MKQKLKISIGSSLQKAATCLTVAATIAALSISFSCSSDNDYEEPWLNKEHRTRASMDIEPIERDAKFFKAGSQEFTYKINHDFVEYQINAVISWDNGTDGMPWPTPHMNLDYDLDNTSLRFVFHSKSCSWQSLLVNQVSANISFNYLLVKDMHTFGGELICDTLTSGLIHRCEDIQMEYLN